jgi:DNA transformation protein and related proteins
MARNSEFIDFVKDLLTPLGPVSSRPMFSGAGIYCEGVIFALILRDVLYFKVDAQTRAAYAAEGSAPFSYAARGRTVEIGSYWRAPERLFDEPEEMVTWARAALATGRRAEASKRPRRGRRSR